VKFEVHLAETAIADLESLFIYLDDTAGETIATAYVANVRAACFSLAHFPRRGSPRDDIRPGLRSIPCERTVTIFYDVGETEVQIVRVIHARRDVAAAFGEG
jgi:toxin ParE1/3/4